MGRAQGGGERGEEKGQMEGVRGGGKAGEKEGKCRVSEGGGGLEESWREDGAAKERTPHNGSWGSEPLLGELHP